MAQRTVPQALPSEFGVYFALLEVGALVQHGVQGQLRADGGLSFVQFQILAVLAEHPETPQSMTDIADRIVHSRSGLTYQISNLATAGLVARVPSPDDERGVNVTLTPAGASLLARVLPGHVSVVHDVLIAALDDEDRDELTRLLTKVTAHMRSQPSRVIRR